MNCVPVLIAGCRPNAEGKIYTRCVKCGFVFGPHFPVEIESQVRECSRPDSQRIPLPLPPLLDRAKAFREAWLRHVRLGRPVVPTLKIIERFRHCSSCDYYNDAEGGCSICGCSVNLTENGWLPNKLQWADEACPKPLELWPAEGQWALSGQST